MCPAYPAHDVHVGPYVSCTEHMVDLDVSCDINKLHVLEDNHVTTG